MNIIFIHNMSQCLCSKQESIGSELKELLLMNKLLILSKEISMSMCGRWTGLFSKISTLLAENKIGIFAVSTYTTDYIFTKKENFQRAINILKDNDYKII